MCSEANPIGAGEQGVGDELVDTPETAEQIIEAIRDQLSKLRALGVDITRLSTEVDLIDPSWMNGSGNLEKTKPIDGDVIAQSIIEMAKGYSPEPTANKPSALNDIHLFISQKVNSAQLDGSLPSATEVRISYDKPFALPNRIPLNVAEIDTLPHHDFDGDLGVAIVLDKEGSLTVHVLAYSRSMLQAIEIDQSSVQQV